MIRALQAFAIFLVGCGLPTGDMIIYPADAPELAAASVEDGVWESMPWTGSEWLPYPPRATIEVEHGLGRTPRTVLVYLSFEPSGEEPALAAGDLARFIEADDTTLTVRNETSARFFARVVAF